MSTSTPTCLACGVFKHELAALVNKNRINLHVHTLESLLHMNPGKLATVLEKATAEKTGKDYLLLYGDCQPRMHEMQERKNISRVAGINCCEILLGKAQYRKLQREGAFIFLPEWAMRWREIFTSELGFTKPENARLFLREHLKKLVFIDTGVIPVPTAILDEIKVFFEMPFEVLPITLDHLQLAIEQAVLKFHKNEAP